MNQIKITEGLAYYSKRKVTEFTFQDKNSKTGYAKLLVDNESLSPIHYVMVDKESYDNAVSVCIYGL